MNQCPTCYLEDQKAEWKKEKHNAAVDAAKKQALENGETMAIIKEGPKYIIVSAATAAGNPTAEFISKHQ